MAADSVDICGCHLRNAGIGALDGKPSFRRKWGGDKEVTLTAVAEDGERWDPAVKWIAVEPGEDAVLKVIAHSDAGPLTYKWYVDGAQREGASTDTYTVSNITYRQDVRCDVSDGTGAESSVDFNITIDNELEVDAEQGYVIVEKGGTATLKVRASSKRQGPLTYSWRRYIVDPAAYDEDDEQIEPVEGFSDTLEVRNVTQRMRYWCEVKDAYGNSVSENFEVYVDTGLEVTSNAGEFNVEPDENLNLEVTATAKEPEKISYAWRFDGANGDWKRLTETTGRLSLENIQSTGTYTCRIYDGYGNAVERYFYVTVDSGLKLEYTEKVTAKADETVTLSVQATSKIENSYHYQWYLDWPDDKEIEGANKAEYSIPNIQKATGLSCRVEDRYGNVDIAYFDIAIENGLKLTYQAQHTLQPGQPVTLSVNATTDDPSEELTYRWFYEDSEGWIGEEKSLTLQEPKSRWYYCAVTDKYGNREDAEIDVKVENDLSVTLDQTEISLEPGETATVAATVTAKENDGITYQWYACDEEGEIYAKPLSRQSTATLDHVGMYRLYVYDKYGNGVQVEIMVTDKSDDSPSQPGDNTGEGTGGNTPGGNTDDNTGGGTTGGNTAGGGSGSSGGSGGGGGAVSPADPAQADPADGETEPVPTEPTIPDGSADIDSITPSEQTADAAPVDKSIPAVTVNEIKTGSSVTAGKFTIKFPVAPGVDNYRVQYRQAGDKTWDDQWSAGEDGLEITKLKKASLCELRIAGYVKREDGSWSRSAWTKTSYLYINNAPVKKVQAGKRSLKVTYAKDKKSGGYQVLVATKKNMSGAKVITVKGKAKTGYTVKNLKKGKKYYVQVRPIKSKAGKTYLGILSKAKAVKVK